MSLFENDEYQWRETFFILFDERHQPSSDKLEAALRRLDPRYVVRDVRTDDQGRFESLTLVAPDDYSAMDISLVRGDEVVEQTNELLKELLKNAASAQEKQQIRQLHRFRCRYDVYHFEQLVFVGREEGDDDLDDFLDPGAVLTVMQKLAELCQGVIVDPQAYAII